MIYKGKLEIKKDDKQSIKAATQSEYSEFRFTPQFEKRFNKLDVTNKSILFQYITSIKEGISLIEDEKVKSALNNAFKQLNIEEQQESDNLYSEVEINGVMYGRELFTGLCFPLFIIGNNIDCNYLVNVTSDYEIINCGSIPDTRNFTDYKIERTIEIDIPDIPLCVSFISPMGLANNNEISAYLNKLNRGLFHTKREQLFRKKITTLYNSNAYADTFTEKHSIEEIQKLQKTKHNKKV